jgi:LysR family transcriptional regulator for bpeEF and oprC
MGSVARIEVFVKVGELGSFTAAANRLGITTAAVSKSVRLLEEGIGVQLLRRTTRTVKLTESGLVYFERCKRALTDLREAEDEISSNTKELKGKLRIDMPVAFGHTKVVTALGKFAQLHPKLEIESSLTERMLSLEDENIDIAIRIGELADSSYMFKKLRPVKFITCASPDYLKRKGGPKSPDDLPRFECINYLESQVYAHYPWFYTIRGRQTELRPKARLSFTTGEAILQSLLNGNGIGQLHDYIVEEAIRTGKLKAILTAFTPPETMISALYLKHRHLSAKVRACVDFLMNECGKK